MEDQNKYKDGIAMKTALEQYLKAMGIDRKVLETSILNQWVDLMGESVAKRTEKLEIRDKKLFVKLNSSVMRSELFQNRSVIIKRINDAAGFDIINDVFLE